jgi:hypothetical protein
MRKFGSAGGAGFESREVERFGFDLDLDFEFEFDFGGTSGVEVWSSGARREAIDIDIDAVDVGPTVRPPVLMLKDTSPRSRS